jgi:hypothetical protein
MITEKTINPVPTKPENLVSNREGDGYSDDTPCKVVGIGVLFIVILLWRGLLA